MSFQDCPHNGITKARFGLLTTAALTITVTTCFGDIRPSDSAITTQVEQALRSERRLCGSEIKVKTTAGVVTLLGTVPGYLEKDRAKRVCELVSGVESVKSELRVRLFSDSDDEIVRAIQQRFRRDIVLRDSKLDVESTGHTVTIKGTVEDHSQWRRAGQLAREIPGVVSVRNHATVAGRLHADELIRSEVVARLERESLLSGTAISISVEQGIVTLEGAVRDRSQRELAEALARSVSDVRRVDNRLEVVRNDLSIEPARAMRPDTVVQRVMGSLRSDRLVDASRVDVSFENEEIVLRGTIPNRFQCDRITENLTRCASTNRISNSLIIEDEAREDTAIACEVELSIKNDSVLADQCISVTVDGGVVTLSGDVDSFTPKHHAMKWVAPIRGVRGITNKIKVRWSATLSDDALEKLVMRNILECSSTKQAAEDVVIQVAEGTVTLSGLVSSRSMRHEFIRVASETDVERPYEFEVESLRSGCDYGFSSFLSRDLERNCCGRFAPRSFAAPERAGTLVSMRGCVDGC